jgi:hypothetical protein
MQERQICYIDFRITEQARFEVLLRFFEFLKSWSQQQHQVVGPSSLDSTQESRAVSLIVDATVQRSFDAIENWLLVFRPRDLELLGMPPHASAIPALRTWRGLSKRERRETIGKDASLATLADFADTLRQFEKSEFELLGLRATSPDRARLEYAISHYPYEGKPALEGMLLFFGFFSILDSNG